MTRKYKLKLRIVVCAALMTFPVTAHSNEIADRNVLQSNSQSEILNPDHLSTITNSRTYKIRRVVEPLPTSDTANLSHMMNPVGYNQSNGQQSRAIPEKSRFVIKPNPEKTTFKMPVLIDRRAKNAR